MGVLSAEKGLRRAKASVRLCHLADNEFGGLFVELFNLAHIHRTKRQRVMELFVLLQTCQNKVALLHVLVCRTRARTLNAFQHLQVMQVQ